MSLGSKLKGLRESRQVADKQWTAEYVAGEVGVSKGMISHYEKGKNKPSHEVLIRLASLYNTSIDDLLAGTGVSESAAPYGIPKPQSVRQTQLYLSQLPEKDAELYIPYYDVEITAGQIEQYFEDADERPEGYIYAPQYRNCIACNVKGDSMYDRIFPGSRLYVYHLPTLKYIDFGQIYLIILDGFRLLKFIDPVPGDDTRVLLRSYNTRYADWSVERADILNLFLVKGYENQSAI